MGNYEELIKRLRVAVDVYEVRGCVLEISAETCAEIADAIEELMKERDAAVKDLFKEADSGLNTCLYCKKDADCVLDCDNALWEWRGVQE